MWDLRAAVGRGEAARVCGVSVDTIKRRLRDGRFPHAWRTGPDQRWAIPLQDLIDARMLPHGAVSAMAVPAREATTGPAGDASSSAAAPATPDDVARLAEALAENRGLRAELARAQDEIAFLRALLTSGRVA